MDLNYKVNDYDKFAQKRHYEVTNGMKKSLRFVEKPMMISDLTQEPFSYCLAIINI